jgi:hypothetical protein
MRIQRLSYLALAGFTAAAISVSLSGNARAAACDEVWKPVCGKVDGYQHTFTNLCWAKMEKAKSIHKGACKWK